MLAYSFYEMDMRVMRYAESLAKRGDEVDVISLRRSGQAVEDVIRGVRICRIQERTRDEKGPTSYLTKILRFLFKSAILLSWRHVRKPYHLLHVHNVPDFLVFAALIPKFLGARIILDIHDILPEFYANKFKSGKEGVGFRVLALTEKVCAGFAHHVIVSNHLWEKTLISRSAPPEKVSVFMNYPDESLFYLRQNSKRDHKCIMLYPGTLNRHQGLDISIKALSMVRDEVPDLEFHIYGEGNAEATLKEQVRELRLNGRVRFHGTIPSDEIVEVMSKADLAVVPKRNDSFGGEAFSTKILQFMALGVPVIAAATKIDRFYFNDSVVKFFEPENEEDLARCMVALVRDKSERERLSANALKFVENYTWGQKKKEYLDLVDRLTSSK